MSCLPKRTGSVRKWLRSMTILLCIGTSGCSAAFYGIKPDPNDFREEGLIFCRQIHNARADQNGCVEYESTVRRARALENAYLTLERVNRWSIFVGTTIALGSIGALTGLYAFGHAASDAAKIIPIAGTFAGSLIAYLSNDAKADAYEDARYEVGRARSEAEAEILPPNITGRSPEAYNKAQSNLNRKIFEIEMDLAQKIRAGRLSLEELKKKSVDLQVENKQLVFIRTYHVAKVELTKPAVAEQPAVPAVAADGNNPEVPAKAPIASKLAEVTITLNRTLTLEDATLLATNGTVHLDDIEVKIKGTDIQGDAITIAVPNSVKMTSGTSHALYVKLGAHELTPATSFRVS